MNKFYLQYQCKLEVKITMIVIVTRTFDVQFRSSFFWPFPEKMSQLSLHNREFLLVYVLLTVTLNCSAFPETLLIVTCF